MTKHIMDEDKRPREEENNLREPSSRRARNEPRQWLAAPSGRRQPRVGDEYQIASLPSVGLVEQSVALEETSKGKENEETSSRSEN